MDREKQAQENRKMFPYAAECMDALEAAGISAKLRYAKEGGKTIGYQLDESRCYVVNARGKVISNRGK